MAKVNDRKMLNKTAYIVSEVSLSSFTWNGEEMEVANFSLVENVNGKKKYTNCSCYGKWAEMAKDLEKGDYIHVFGYFKERVNKEKTYKNFIVSHMNRVAEKTVKDELDNKEEI